MPKIKIIAAGVTLGGQDIAVGDEIEVSERSAASLIESGHAEGGAVADANPDAGGQGGGNEPTEAELQAKALDSQYKRDELYEAAKEAGVDISFDAKKGEIIAAVIAQGFAAALIK
ncbi:hypothetical protein [Paenibacillus sp. MMO-177]|uniref:hypothetical protein n=1 Tax=Paenibacillus sp. MMO-177 TaxID=3081289 RepID=UPI00301794F0